MNGNQLVISTLKPWPVTKKMHPNRLIIWKLNIKGYCSTFPKFKIKMFSWKRVFSKRLQELLKSSKRKIACTSNRSLNFRKNSVKCRNSNKIILSVRNLQDNLINKSRKLLSRETRNCRETDKLKGSLSKRKNSSNSFKAKFNRSNSLSVKLPLH